MFNFVTLLGIKLRVECTVKQDFSLVLPRAAAC